jgi:hypothetical protein
MNGACQLGNGRQCVLTVSLNGLTRRATSQQNYDHVDIVIHITTARQRFGKHVPEVTLSTAE